MEYQAYILPKKRDRFFQHFLSSTAEDVYLNKYTALTGDITLTGSFFDMGMREIALPYDNISKIIDFYLVNFMRVKDGANYYYYNITGVIKQTQTLILYRVELDEYHTFFNNHGNYYNFKGYLKYSNTRCVADEAKLFTPPSKSLSEYRYKSLPFKTFFDGVRTASVLVFKGAKTGINVVVVNENSPNFYQSMIPLNWAGKLSNLRYHYKDGDEKKTLDENIEIIAAYIIPQYYIETSGGRDSNYWTFTTTNAPQYDFYVFTPSLAISQDIDITNYHTKIIEFGTFSSRLNLGVNGKILTVFTQLVKMGDGIEIILWCGSQKISISKDFEVVISSSAINQYINSNKITLALKGIAAVGGTAASIVTGNIVGAISGVAAGANIANEVYQETQKTGNIYGESGAELSYLFTNNNTLMHTNDPFYLWVFDPENENFLIETKLLYGGDCRNLPISFEYMTTMDRKNPTAAYNYYEFTKIVSDYPQVNRIAPLLLGGIEMEFIE